ncbi:MAG TPA: J domain-containing protein [Spirochaetia bacterium]|nr:J domain-containing protein [Spirochaetia bacterium]
MPMIFGRLFGAVSAGIVAGPFGVVFGFIVGLLVDQILRDRYIHHVLSQFYRDPRSRLISHLDAGTLSLIGVSIHLCSLVGTVRTGQVELLRGVIAKRRPGRRSRQAVDRAIDEAIKQVRALNVPALGFRLRANLSNRQPRNGARQRQDAGSADFDFGEIVQLFRLMVGMVQVEDQATADRIESACGYVGIDSADVISRPATEAGLDPRACAILGVDRQASIAEIKAVFRRLAGQFHPDSLAGLDEVRLARSAEAFIRIKEAYDTLIRQFDSDGCRIALNRSATTAPPA